MHICFKFNHLLSFLELSTDSEMLKDVMKYSRQELEVACEDFSNIIGSSPDSHVYKGTLKGGPEIAVISLCVKEEHWTGFLELYYQKEVINSTFTICKRLNHENTSSRTLRPYYHYNKFQVADLARLNHENAGKLLGYCQESSPFTRMLIFEYASNGTLYEHLHCKDFYFIILSPCSDKLHCFCNMVVG